MICIFVQCKYNISWLSPNNENDISWEKNARSL